MGPKCGCVSSLPQIAYEAYGPGGTGFIIECLTDNLNRTAGDIRGVMSKTDGKASGRKGNDAGSSACSCQRQ